MEPNVRSRRIAVVGKERGGIIAQKATRKDPRCETVAGCDSRVRSV